jgi:hypothetical protein
MAAGWNDALSESTVRSYYEAIVILSWTAFETVAEDLWEAAVNARPYQLARGTVQVDKLKFLKFDTSKMGTILKKPSQFRRLETTRQFYEETFKDQLRPIKDILDRPELQYTAAVRHLLIHKGGIIDKDYLKDIEDVPGAFTSAEGTPFPLTGKVAYDRSQAALQSAADLLNVVHTWVIGHPE